MPNWLRCITCNGDSRLMGMLGKLAHYNCVYCGTWFSTSSNEVDIELQTELQEIEI